MFASTQYTIITYFFPLLEMQGKLIVWLLYMMTLVFLIREKKTFHFSSWFRCICSYDCVKGVGATRFPDWIFSCFFFRWPMVVARYLSRYLVTYAAINPGHESGGNMF